MPLSIAEKLKQKLEREILMFHLKPASAWMKPSLPSVTAHRARPCGRRCGCSPLRFGEDRAHRGAVVARLSITELVEIFEMMAVYEGVCARLAAQRVDARGAGADSGRPRACRQRCEKTTMTAIALPMRNFTRRSTTPRIIAAVIRQTVSTRNRLGAYRRFPASPQQPAERIVSASTKPW